MLSSLATVGKLTRKYSSGKDIFSEYGFFCKFCSKSCSSSKIDFCENFIKFFRIFCKIVFEIVIGHIFHSSSYIAISKSSFCLSFKLRFRDFYSNDTIKTVCYIRILKFSDFFVYFFSLLSDFVHNFQKSWFETENMSSSIFCRNIIYKRKGVIIVGIEKLERNLCLAVFCLSFEIVSWWKCLLISNKIFEPSFDTSFVEKSIGKSGF